jgi:hypothetical protein
MGSNHTFRGGAMTGRGGGYIIPCYHYSRKGHKKDKCPGNHNVGRKSEANTHVTQGKESLVVGEFRDPSSPAIEYDVLNNVTKTLEEYS